MSRIIFKLFIANLLILLFAKPVSAQVVINEIFTSSSSTDWIELYNTSDSEVDLLNWQIKDTASSVVYEFESEIIPANGYCLKEVGNRFNNGGDTIFLLQGSTQKDCIAYGDGNKQNCGSEKYPAVDGQQTLARKPNGLGDFILSDATAEYSNNETISPAQKIVCYAKTQQTPTSSPKATNTPTFSPEPSPKEEQSQAKTADSRNVPTTLSSPKPEVKAVTTEVNKEKAQEEIENQQKERTNLRSWLAVSMITLGLGIIGYVLKPLLNEFAKKYNEKHEF